ncbi:MarR family transcriptional regulator [Deinococcus sp. SDU3-2]|uniref:MarR family transcriptional regulator n=1 Tax=Deinococcus terrestris TaxID=2651870 RepID=A0A7X1NXC5_9DEIO|nr:MarR family transcriptional regulator [Deinococcus terrestris]MPY67428.1 MarR family transcriptional regulator [Deinococcus terrestris]
MTPLTAEGAAFTELLLEIFRLHGRLLEAGDRLTSPLGLTSARWQVLGVVEHGPVTVSEIGRVMGLARQSVQQQTDALEREGFVTYVENPRHRRARLVQLTQKGEQAAAALIPAQAQWANRIGQSASSPEQLQAALDTLRLLTARLERDADSDA